MYALRLDRQDKTPMKAPMKYFDVIVIGASFAGLACAKEASRKGLSVAVLERKRDVRETLHTTGVLVQEAADLISVPDGVCKKINQVRLYAPSLRYLEISSDSYLFLATDTPELMQHLVADADICGVSVLLGTPFFNAVEESDQISVNDGAFSCRFLVGADGATSKVADICHLGKNTKFLMGTEYEYTGGAMENPDAFYCFLNKKLAPGYIGWVISGPQVVQVGLAKTYHNKKHNKKQSRPDIEGFLTYIRNELKLVNPKIVEKRGGLIPVGGVVKPFYRNNIILVGDAAGIVSPLTAGGIHTALFYGQRLGELISSYLKDDGPHPGKVLEKEYPRFLHKYVYRWVFEKIPDVLFNIIFCMPLFHYVARMLFFLKKRLPKRRPQKTAPFSAT